MDTTKGGRNWSFDGRSITFLGRTGQRRPNDMAVRSWIYDGESCEMIEVSLEEIEGNVEDIISTVSTGVSEISISAEKAVELFLVGYLTERDLDRIKEGGNQYGSYIKIPGVNISGHSVTFRITG